VWLGLLRGRGEQAALVMTDARTGRLMFEVSLRDLRSMFSHVCETVGCEGGLQRSRRDPEGKQRQKSSLFCEVHVRGSWLFVPTSFAITGRIDIDDGFDAHLSQSRLQGPKTSAGCSWPVSSTAL